jgi:hypothetical protein
MNFSIAMKSDMTQDCHQNRSRRIRMALGVIASLLYIIVRAHTPISVHAESIHDDQLFMSMGQRIARGHWLGAYNQMTLIKGPGYPLFLAANAWLGTSLALSEALFLALGVGLFFWLFARMSRMFNVAMFGYIATLWMPAPYLERIMRDCIYPGQMLLVLAGMAASLYIDMPRKHRYACALSTGLVLGWFSLTREESIWIAPGLAVIALLSFLHPRNRQSVRPFVLAPLAVISIGYGITQVTFSCINKIAYGSFVRVEINSSPFKDAMAALQSVEVGKQIPYVPVSKQAREAIYQVSPSFSQLKGYLDPSTGSPWQFGCHFYPETCGDIAGGWFIWAVRDAVAINGYYTSPKSAANFYRRLANEVEGACQSGKLQCKPLLFGMIPRISTSQWRKLPDSLIEALRMVTFYNPPLADIPSSGPPAALMSDMEFLGSPPRTTSPDDFSSYSIAGWYYGKEQKGWIAGEVTSGDEVSEVHVARTDSPDLVGGLGDPTAAHQRFNSTISCQAPCIYRFVDDTGASVAINLADQVGHASQYPMGRAILNIDQISSSSSSGTNLQRHFASRWRNAMEWSYGHVLPWLLPLSLLAMLITILISALRRTLTIATIIAIALWTLFISRLALLALVDISSFPAVVVPYLSPAYVLACVTPILSFAALYEQVAISRTRPSS